MASDNELKNMYLIQYQDLLDLIKDLEETDPNNVKGYNLLVKYARKILKRAEVMGLDSLDPLPPLK